MRPHHLLVIASVFFVFLYILVLQPFANAIKKSTQVSSYLYSKLISETLLYAIYDEKKTETLREFIQKLDYPIIITDEFGNPRAWCNIGINPDMFSPEELANPEKLKSNKYYEKILKIKKKLAKKRPPLPIKNPFKEKEIIGYLYYGYPKIIRYLNLLPFILTFLGLLMLGIMWWIASKVKEYEIQSIWGYIAKELAHQLATPISAINGWITLSNEKYKGKIEKELQKINSILKRFSKIGFKPNLQILNLKEVIDTSLKDYCYIYLKDFKKIEIEIPENIYFMGDKELFCWAVENLVKNAWQSRNHDNPTFKIEAKLHGKNKIEITFKDNGKGIPSEIQNALFKKPVSTKKRGWGIGLIIAKRIIEEIHGGKIKFIKSIPYEETIFEIILKGV